MSSRTLNIGLSKVSFRTSLSARAFCRHGHRGPRGAKCADVYCSQLNNDHIHDQSWQSIVHDRIYNSGKVYDENIEKKNDMKKDDDMKEDDYIENKKNKEHENDDENKYEKNNSINQKKKTTWRNIIHIFITKWINIQHIILLLFISTQWFFILSQRILYNWLNRTQSYAYLSKLFIFNVELIV